MHTSVTTLELTKRPGLALVLFLAVITLFALTHHHAAAAEKPPVLIGLDGEFGHASSTSAEAIKQGILIALEDINQHGGVLGGRKLQLVERANHAVPARSIANLREFASMPELVAVYCGRFSPTVLEAVPLLHELELPLLDPWAAADAIVDNGKSPNFVFRLSLKDSWAAPVMLDYLARKGVKKVGLMMLNTGWGRSTKKAAEEYLGKKNGTSIVDTQWINWDDKEDTMLVKYRALRDRGAQGILLTANAEEAAVLGKAMLSLPENERLPVASHWGVTGGDLPKLVGADFFKLDFAVVQTYSFINNKSQLAGRVVADHNRMFGSKGAREILSQVGVAHAYDLTQLLARAINKAGTTERKAVRNAMEKLGSYDGLVRKYEQPFTGKRHEALDIKNVFMARYASSDGALEKIQAR
jgi:branched-chain amino acid transport system substrate-binding protein